ncbi:MAG: UDP-N-acetylmuramate--L-alanine ligase, partial [Acidobacteriota bacterium]|nr:UDP-N-acetylmuramate--L-alanine ligase [Acidobacteriota bacterium]
YPDRRLVALFQPHLYSRTRDFAGEFGRVLTAADLAIVTDVYPSREQPISGVSGELVTAAARSYGHASVVYVPKKEGLAAELDRLLKPGDLLLTMGAGDIVKFGEEYLRRG